MSDSKIAAILADRKNTRAALAAELVARNEECETLRAKLSVARFEYAKLRAAQPQAAPRPAIQPVITRFTKHDGTVWEKTRIGNTATVRQVEAA